MSIETRPLRYAHAEGHTDLCYADGGKRMITCGNDGDIRIWINIDDPDPESYCVGENALSVAQKNEDIYICRDDGRVVIHKYPNGERNGMLTRYTAPGTHVTVGKNSSTIACGSGDCSVTVFKSGDTLAFHDLQGVALGVAISPDDKYLAASCGDGKLYIWYITTRKLLKTIDCIPKCNCFTSANVLCRVSFSPNSEFLAYPNAKEIIVAETNKFEPVYSLRADEIQSPYSHVEFSPGGDFIAASTTTGDICVWKNRVGSIPAVAINSGKYNISALAWNPQGNGEISFCDVNGQLGTYKYSSDTIPPAPSETRTQEDEIKLDDDDDVDAYNHNDDENDDDNENAISLEKIKNETLGLLPPSPSAASGSTSRPGTPERPKSPPCLLQPPFQPGSTPIHLTQRFLTYNDIGVVRLHTEEDNDSSIDVMFHDATLFKNLFMKNHLNHTMASLSKSVLALAGESKLVCIPLKSGAKEWSVDLSDLEEISCVTASETLVAIATNVRMFRIFSTSGTQCAVLSIPGPVVSAASFKTTLFIVYHACTAHSKDQNLAGMLMQFDGINISNRILPIPITPQSTLTWIGFTDVGALASYDSCGILRICKPKSDAWIPACDTSIHMKGASDSYFMIHVSETYQTVQVIHCKGAIYPATTPLPILMELPMQVPFCELETDKTQLEEKLFRWSQFENDQPDKAFRETALKLFALACRNNLEDRAYDLINMLQSVELINLALKYSNKLGRTRLVSRLKELQNRVQGNEEEEQDDDNNQNNPHMSLKMNRQIKTRIEPTPSNDLASQSCTPDLFTCNTMESSMNDESLIHSTPLKNPFLKQTNNEEKKNPLSLTNSLDHVQGASQQKDKPNEHTNNNNNKEEVASFKTWYDKNKTNLEKKHPEKTREELLKFALKQYKQQNAEKRKANDDNDNHLPKSKQAKLSEFAYTKR